MGESVTGQNPQNKANGVFRKWSPIDKSSHRNTAGRRRSPGRLAGGGSILRALGHRAKGSLEEHSRQQAQ